MGTRLWTAFLRGVHAWTIVCLAVGTGTHPLIAATYYVDPVKGDDTRTQAKAQDPASPWKSLSRATRASLAAGDIIRLAPGTYDASTGEKFPISLISNVAVVGSGSALSRIQGTWGSPVLTHTVPLGSQTWLGDLGIDVTPNVPRTSGEPTISAVVNQSDGLQIDVGLGVSAPTLDAVSFGEHLVAGIGLHQATAGDGGFAGTIQNSTFSSGNGIQAYLSSAIGDFSFAPRIVDNLFAPGDNGIDLEYMSMDGRYEVDAELTGNHFEGGYLGLYLYGSDLIDAPACHLLISNNTFSDVQYAVDVSLSTMTLPDAETLELDVDLRGNVFEGGYNHLYSYLYNISDGSIDAAWTVLGNTFSRPTDEAMVLSVSNLSGNAVSHALDIEDNTFRNIGSEEYSAEAIYAWVYSLYGVAFDSQVTVVGNTMDGVRNGAIELSYSQFHSANVSIDAQIRENEVRDARYGVYWWLSRLESSRADVGLTIANNSFEGIEYNGLSLSNSSIHSETVNRVSIVDNFLSGVQQGGPYLLEADIRNGPYDSDVLIAGNTLTDVGNGMTVSQYSWSGLDVAASGVSIIGNEVLGSDDEGFYVYRSNITSNGSADLGLTIAGNTIEGTGYSGIHLSQSAVSSNDSVYTDVAVLNNSVRDSSDEGIFAGFGGNTGNLSGDLKVLIGGNAVSGAGSSGIDLEAGDFSGSALVLDMTVAGNATTGNAGAGVAARVTSVSALSSPIVRVLDNTSSGNEYGLELYGYDFGNAEFVTVYGNTFSDNDVGVQLESFSDAAPVATADFGGGRRSSPGKNIIRNNGTADFSVQRDVAARDAGQETSVTGLPVVSARNNYWGITDAAAIDARILDDEEGGSAKVDFGTPLPVAPARVTPTATLVAHVTGDSGLTGATPGDTLKYTATLKASGELGCALARFTAPLPPGAALVPGSVTTTRGTDLRSDDEGIDVGLGWMVPGDVLYITWQVVSASDASCAATPVQGALSCDGLDDVLTDDPTTTTAGDPTTLTWTQNSYYADADADGYGDAANVVRVCLPGVPDGYVSDATDCDDHQADVYPGAAERCDQADNDCDGSTDEDVGATWYADDDDDGHGDAASTVVACTAPDGYVGTADDCDDGEADVYPGAAEVCDLQDNNCDGAIDEIGTNVFFADTDGDGYGDAGAATVGCTALSGYVDNAGDCDDADDAVSPEADEVCDGVDNDCDAQTDEDLTSFWYVDADADGFGSADLSGPDAVVVACAAPAGYVDNADDCDDAAADVNPDADEVCDGVDNDCDAQADEDLVQVWFADADGDGYGTSDVVQACEAPAGYADAGGDCDDGAAAVNPGATEACDDVDNNCDGAVDEPAECAASPTPGDDGSGSCACDARSSRGGTAPAAWAGVSLALVAMRRRRRRGR